MLPFLKNPSSTIYESPKDPHDLRLKNIIKPWNGGKAEIGILGVPFDEAITAGGGRSGAKEGPETIRKALKRFGPTYSIDFKKDISHLKIVDCGDVDVIPGNARKTHDRVAVVIQSLLEKGILPIVLGGGNDITFGSLKGLSAHHKTFGGINADAHFDLREVKNNIITSGTPYRRALEEFSDHFSGDRFTEIGLGEGNSKAHHDYAKKQGISLFTLRTVRQKGVKKVMAEALKRVGKTGFFSIDIDVVQQSFAPGCSAPAPLGLNPEEITEMAFSAGQSKAVRLFEIMEVSPPYDQDGRTARLAAAIIFYFLLGYSFR